MEVATANAEPLASGRTDPAENQYQDALRLWLQWDEAQQRACAELYQSRSSPERIQDKLDELDQLRARAVSLSRKLVH